MTVPDIQMGQAFAHKHHINCMLLLPFLVLLLLAVAEATETGGSTARAFALRKIAGVPSCFEAETSGYYYGRIDFRSGPCTFHVTSNSAAIASISAFNIRITGVSNR